ncbi:hypothetical protein VRY85_06345 [Achromobacter sp. F4_2707]|uniref:hypothetical protein n=1 Tax=Achromobacter sp. F4_2707 TaxID=3114286 RepID=UPI0039C73310
MAQKKTQDTCNPPTLTVTDVAGFIHLMTRNSEQGDTLGNARQTLEAAERVLKILGNRLTRVYPDVRVIETELQREPIDAYTLIGLCEVAKRGEAWFGDHIDRRMRANEARTRALMRHHFNSREATAKEFVRELWVEWQKRKSEGCDPYPKGKAQFARDVLEKFDDDAKKPVLKTITDSWCPKWERGN